MFRRVLAALAAVVALVAPVASPGFQAPPALEALVGEVLEFRIRWGAIPAATASLEVLPGEDGLLTFRARARTLPYVDAIFPVRDTIESTVRPPNPTVVRFRKKTQEGWKKSREDLVFFDPQKGSTQSFRDGRPRRTLLVPPGVQDPLSSFYAFRVMPLEGRDTVEMDITDGNRLVTGSVSVLQRETVKTPLGTFSTVLVEPSIEGIGGIFQKSPGARVLIWLTDDRWRRPVKLQSAVVVGSFTAELVRITPPAPRPPDPE